MSCVRTEIKDRVAVVTFDRPPVNALNAEAFRALTATFRGFAESKEVSVAILTAPGDRVFCAGVDLEDSRRRLAMEVTEDDTLADLLDTGVLPRECFWSVLDCAVPVIGAINGKAIGAGMALASCCDVLVASDTASFSAPEIKAGVLGGARHLQRLVGPYKMRRMFFTGEPAGAEELHRLGAVEAVVPADRLMETALDLAGRIAANSPIGLRLAKEAMNRVESLDLRDGYRIEQSYTAQVGRYNDTREAREAYKEKRPGRWTWS
jgi:enoyl-CoA hydratase